jgi:hypothetical protein
MIVAGLCAVALLGVGTGTAFAGEVTGNGKDTAGPSHANSICVFSGQNDDPDAPFPEGGRVQSYGQAVKAGVISPQRFNPGDACRGGSDVPE